MSPREGGDVRLQTIADQQDSDGIQDHTCDDSLVDCKVSVNGTRVPVANVDIHIRKEGPASVSRYAEGEIASPFRGTDYIDAFQGIDEDKQENLDTVRIDVKDYETGNFATQFHGIVTGVGNGSGLSRIWNFRAQGPSFFLDKVPASETFQGGQGIQPATVLDYVRTELDSTLPYELSAIQSFGGPADVDSTAGLPSQEELEDEGITTPPGFDPEEFEDEYGSGQNVGTTKRFTPNRHTLTDVITWFEDKTDSRVWLAPTGGGALLTTTQTPNQFTHRAHYLDGDEPVIRVVENDALSELRPINTLVGTGQATRSRNAVSQYQEGTPSKVYARVKARHTDLYQRAGKTELYAGTNVDIDAQPKDEVEAEVRRRLAENIEQTKGGDMTTLLRSPVQPFDIIKAKPTCNEQAGTNTKTLNYEVNRVHMKIRSSISTCEINVGVQANAADKIEIVTSEWKEV